MNKAKRTNPSIGEEGSKKEDPVITIDFLLDQSGETITKVLTLSKITKIVWYSRMKEPHKFTIEEIENLAKALNGIEKLYDRPANVTPQLVFEAIRNTIKLSKEESNS